MYLQSDYCEENTDGASTHSAVRLQALEAGADPESSIPDASQYAAVYQALDPKTMDWAGCIPLSWQLNSTCSLYVTLNKGQVFNYISVLYVLLSMCHFVNVWVNVSVKLGSVKVYLIWSNFLQWQSLCSCGGLQWPFLPFTSGPLARATPILKSSLHLYLIDIPAKSHPIQPGE